MIHPPADPSTARVALTAAQPPSEPVATTPRRRLARQAISADPEAAERRYIVREQLRSLVPASDMTIWRWTNDPQIAFPSPHKLGADGRNYWWLPAIHLWMRQRQERQVKRPAGGRHGAKGGTA
jgi:predicted DNA-binding transcriptional regulator AlpA